ncbi:hypothetical protein [Rhodoblastus sp.]
MESAIPGATAKAARRIEVNYRIDATIYAIADWLWHGGGAKKSMKG